MATKRKTGTLGTAAKKVKQAAKAVAKKADEYVVEPVSKAIGLKKKPARKKAAASAAKGGKKKAAAKKPAAKKTARSK